MTAATGPRLARRNGEGLTPLGLAAASVRFSSANTRSRALLKPALRRLLEAVHDQALEGRRNAAAGLVARSGGLSFRIAWSVSMRLLPLNARRADTIS